MANYGDLIPACRDYKTAKEAKEAFYSGKDWVISSHFHPSEGKPINIEQIKKDGARKVVLRFHRLTKTCLVDPSKAYTPRPAQDKPAREPLRKLGYYNERGEHFDTLKEALGSGRRLELITHAAKHARSERPVWEHLKQNAWYSSLPQRRAAVPVVEFLE